MTAGEGQQKFNRPTDRRLVVVLLASNGISWLALRNLHCCNRYLATTSDDRIKQKTAWAVFVVIYSVCKTSETVIIICRYELLASNKSKPNV
jgi:hypothetical protein